jgi:hypothetical protein
MRSRRAQATTSTAAVATQSDSDRAGRACAFRAVTSCATAAVITAVTADPPDRRVQWSRRARRVTADTADTAITAVTAVTAVTLFRSGTTVVACAARSGHVSSDATEGGAAERGVATRVAQSERNFGRASERFVRERLQRRERKWPGPLARRHSKGRPATVITVPVTPSSGVTAPEKRKNEQSIHLMPGPTKRPPKPSWDR